MRPDINQLAQLLVETAQAELKPRFRRIGAQLKADGSVLTEADLAMDRRLRETLARKWPGIAFLSEEMPSEAQQEALATGRPLWCLDPLDGTSNFAAGIPLYSVSLALIVDGQPKLGVVYDPERDECFTGVHGEGSRINGTPLAAHRSTVLSRAVGIVDLKRLPKPMAARLACDPPYHSQRNLGTCALEWCWLAAGRGDFYLHGGMRLWDLAAGSLILAETGGKASTLDGDTVFRPTTAPRSVVAACDAGLFDELRQNLSNDMGEQT